MRDKFMLIDGLNITGGWFFIITIMLTPGVFLALAVAAIIFLSLTGKLTIRLRTKAVQLLFKIK